MLTLKCSPTKSGNAQFRSAWIRVPGSGVPWIRVAADRIEGLLSPYRGDGERDPSVVLMTAHSDQRWRRRWAVRIELTDRSTDGFDGARGRVPPLAAG